MNVKGGKTQADTDRRGDEDGDNNDTMKNGTANTNTYVNKEASKEGGPKKQKTLHDFIVTSARSSSSSSSPTDRPLFSSLPSSPSQFQEVRDLGEGAILRWCPNFLTRDESGSLYDHLMQIGNWAQADVPMYGKTIPSPRLMAWMSDLSHEEVGSLRSAPLRWTPEVLKVKRAIESMLNDRCKFDYLLLNYYRNGKDYIGFHSDREASGMSERGNGDKRIVASLSLGVTRRFLLRHKHKFKTGECEQIEYALTAGSLIVMDGEVQKYWKHSVPKEMRVTEGRINMTFRTA